MGLLEEVVVVEAAVAAAAAVIAAVIAAVPAAPAAPPVADLPPLAVPAADHRSKSGSKTAPVPASVPVSVPVSAVSHPVSPPPHEPARPATETTAAVSRSPDPAVKARDSARRAYWLEGRVLESAWKSRRRREILLPCCAYRSVLNLEMWSGWKVSLLGHGRTTRLVVGVGRDEIGGARGPR